MDDPPQNSPNLGLNGLIKETEFLTIINQSLYSLGYTKTALALESQSRVQLDNHVNMHFFRQIFCGEWDDCIASINMMPDLEPRSRSVASFLIWREYFLELLGLEDGIPKANIVLRDRLLPLGISPQVIRDLANLILDKKSRSERAITVQNQVWQRIGLFLNLAEVLPPWIWVRGDRLENLVQRAVDYHVNRCKYYDSTHVISLYEDLMCCDGMVPSQWKQTLRDHKNEVLLVQFSNYGEHLASSSSDCTVIIWKVNNDDTVSLKHTLKGHARPVFSIKWSPDDTKLLTCGKGEVLRLWDVDTGTCHLFTSNVFKECTVSAYAWHPNSEKIIFGTCKPYSYIYECDLHGNRLELLKITPEVSDLSVTPDGRHLICISSDTVIQILEYEEEKECTIDQMHSITSLSLSKDGQFLIISQDNDEIHMLNVDRNSNFYRKFKGHKQKNHMIRSCIGGSNDLFIASGSADSLIYIWHQSCDRPLMVLPGHLRVVNCVSWNPAWPHMLASASDDGTVRIWVPRIGRSKIHP